MSIPLVKIKEFDYHLPDERIAKYPLDKREESKLLVFRNGNISESKFSNYHNYTPTNSLLVFNNTKVIQARVFFKKETGAQIEVLCLEPHSPAEYTQSFEATGKVQWKCIVGNLKKWKEGKLVKEFQFNGISHKLYAERIEALTDSQVIEFSWEDDRIHFSDVLESIGNTPIPPYLNRETESIDKNRYQTVYSKHKGSVAAPTAGLHFTEDIINRFPDHNISAEYVTLHVGAGTFKPVKSDSAHEHEMHTEHFVINKAALENLLNNKGRIIAVGTTSLRTLESIYWLGVKQINGCLDVNNMHLSQWESFNLPQKFSFEDAIQALIKLLDDSERLKLFATTQIMVLPGYRFRVINGLFTNFHQPKSTLLLLIAAFIGDTWKDVYKYAMENEFRFLSYGDSSLLLP